MTHLQYERRDIYASGELHLGPIATALVPPDFTPPLEFDAFEFLRPQSLYVQWCKRHKIDDWGDGQASVAAAT